MNGIYQKCLKWGCGVLFPSFPFNMRSLCPKHNTEIYWTEIVQKWLQARAIPIEIFDLWDKNGIRLCRVCGQPAYRKDGKRSKIKQHKGACMEIIHGLWLSFFWHSIVDTVLSNSPEDPLHKDYVQCVGCKQFMSYNKVEIHHKIPVSVLTPKNFELCWDITNLEIRCITCHDKAESHQLIYKNHHKFKNRVIQYTTLDQLIGKAKP